MVKLKQAIVVEGRYDKKTLENIVDAPIFETSGFGVMHDTEKLRFLRRVASERGLIILTDADGAGFVIRNYLKGALPKEGVYHAYIPEIAGKERRKAHPGREGLMGVEGMTQDVILEALRRAGVEPEGESAPSRTPITRADLYAAGLTGHPGSAALRESLMTRLDLPRHLGTGALLDALNILLSREEFLELVQTL